jgi:hypothetical protein
MDACEVCFGERGGVPGNENIVPVPGTSKKTVMCDYCHADYMSYYMWWKAYEKNKGVKEN